MRILRILLCLMVALAVPAFAQPEIPDISQEASVTQRIGTTDITIRYHRPGVKGRTIWGGLVPYDQPWRMGANEATTIEFSTPVTVEGTEVPAGKYSFFAIPGRESWTLVINKDPEQWGAYGYDASKDQARVTVTPVSQSEHTEWMRFTIDPVTPSTAVVNLEWEKLRVPMNLSVDVEKIVWSGLDRAIATAQDRAAAWALETGQRMDEGLVWVDQSIARQPTIFNLWTKARLLQKLGRSAEALPVMERSVAMAREANVPQDFMNILQGTLDSIRAAARR